MNKIIVGIIVIGIVALIGWSLSSAPSKVSAQITTNKTQHDFGDIDIFGGKVETQYTLTNTGTENVQITSAETSCMCTEGKIDNFTFGMHGTSGKKITIPAGESKTLTAIYDPLAHGPEGAGRIKRDLFIKTNSSATPEIRLQFTANVVKGGSEPASVGGE